MVSRGGGPKVGSETAEAARVLPGGPFPGGGPKAPVRDFRPPAPETAEAAKGVRVVEAPTEAAGLLRTVARFGALERGEGFATCVAERPRFIVPVCSKKERKALFEQPRGRERNVPV